VANTVSRTVARIDPDSNAVVHAIPTGGPRQTLRRVSVQCGYSTVSTGASWRSTRRPTRSRRHSRCRLGRGESPSTRGRYGSRTVCMRKLR
jgi:hypothetical protein